MIHKAKALGLAAMAAFALSAMAASAVSAQVVHSGSGSGTTFGTADLLGINQLDTTAGSIKCTTIIGGASFPGTTASEGTIQGVTVSGCTAFGLEAHVDTMGCDALVTAVTPTTGLGHLICPTTAGGVKDEITVTPTQGGVAICHMDFPEQTITANLTNTAATAEGIPDDVDVTPTATSITYTVTQTAGGAKCGTNGLKHDGKYTGTVTITGFENASHTLRTGLTYT